MTQPKITHQVGIKCIAIFLAMISLCYFLVYSGSLGFERTYAQASNVAVSEKLSYLPILIDNEGFEALPNETQAFIALPANQLSYSIAQGSFWLKIDINNNTNKGVSRVLFSDSALLNLVVSDELGALLQNQTAIANFASEKYQAYTHIDLSLAPFEKQQHMVKIVNNSPIPASLLWSSANKFEQYTRSAPMLHGALLMAIVLLVFYYSAAYHKPARKLVLSYLLLLLCYLLIFTALTVNSYWLFDDVLQQLLNQHLLFFSYCVLSAFLLFTVFYLVDVIATSKIALVAIGVSALIMIVAFYSARLDLQSQYTFLGAATAMCMVLITIILWRTQMVNLRWFYLMTLAPLLTVFLYQNTSYQLIISTHSLALPWFSSQSYMYLSILHLALLAIALRKKMGLAELDKSVYALQDESTGMLKSAVLEHKISQLINNQRSDFNVIVIMPNKLNVLLDYIKDEDSHKLIVKLEQVLSEYLASNKSIVPLGKNNQKLCLLDGCSFSLLQLVDDRPPALNELIDSIDGVIKQYYQLDQLAMDQGAQVGLASYPNNGNNSSQLLQYAKTHLAAKYQCDLPHLLSATPEADTNYQIAPEPALNAGQSRLKMAAHFNSDNHYKTGFYLQLAVDLAQAIKNQDLAIYHQPQIDLKTLRVCASECLLRWQHPTQGELAPDLIIALAEDFGLLNQLTLMVIKKSLAQQLILRDEHNQNHMLSINISGNELCSEHFFQQTLELIEASTIASDKIVFELTHWQHIEDQQRAIDTLVKLSELGITISSDDVDNLYASILNNRPCHYQEFKLKQPWVDKSIQSDLGKLAVKSMIQMAKGSGLEVVAEGITSQQNEEILRELGCDIGQGHLYGKAMRFDDYLQWLNRLTNGRIRPSLQGEFIPADS